MNQKYRTEAQQAIIAQIEAKHLADTAARQEENRKLFERNRELRKEIKKDGQKRTKIFFFCSAAPMLLTGCKEGFAEACFTGFVDLLVMLGMWCLYFFPFIWQSKKMYVDENGRFHNDDRIDWHAESSGYIMQG